MINGHAENVLYREHSDYKKNIEHPKSAKGIVMLVEDDQAISDIVGKALSANGYKVLLATNGLEALNAYKSCKDKINAVLMDLNMPGMDGLTCLKEMRKLDAKMKVAITSGYFDSDLKDKLSNAGANYFVEKPFHISELIECIKEMIK